MSYEINIISINQKKPICLKERNGILLHNETENYEVHRYAKIWPFFSNVEGILYSIIKKCGEDSYSAYELCDSNFDAVAPTEELLGWSSVEVKENLKHKCMNIQIIRKSFYGTNIQSKYI